MQGTCELQLCRYLHSFSCCCLPNLRNPAKFYENSTYSSSGSSKVIDLGVNRKYICSFLLVINSNYYGRIFYRFRDIDAFSSKIGCFFTPPFFDAPSRERNINVIYTPLKSTFNGLQFCRKHCGSIFIRLAAVGSQNHEMMRNSAKFDLTAVQGHPRSSILV